MTENKTRDHSIDALRGLAIITMLAANAAPMLLPEPHPYAFRVYGSFAAPLFIFLAGFMIGKRNEIVSNAHLLKRGLGTVLTAALIDLLIWKIVPFTTFDVLYLIGLGIIFSTLIRKMNTNLLLGFSFLIFIISFLMQHFFSYDKNVCEFSLTDGSYTQLAFGKWWFKSLLFTGWFPIFPWLGFIIAGIAVGKFKNELISSTKLYFSAAAFIGFLFGIYMMSDQNKLTRESYSELFYPADSIYILTALSFITLVYLNRSFFNLQVFSPIHALGRSSLFVYIFHSAIIAYILDIYFIHKGISFYLIYAVYSIFIILVTYGLMSLKKTSFWSGLHPIFKFLLGS